MHILKYFVENKESITLNVRHFIPNYSSGSDNLPKIPNFNKCGKESLQKCEHHRISSTDSKVRTTHKITVTCESTDEELSFGW